VHIALGIVLALALTGGAVIATREIKALGRHHFVAYFDNSNGLFKGDEVRILGVPVGGIDSIEPQPDRVKIAFWVEDRYKVPASVKAVIVSPQLITSRAIQLTPPYSGGPVLQPNSTISLDRTAVPVEWDDLRAQLAKLTDTLQPTKPGGVSTLGALINTTADNLRGQGANIHDTVVKLSKVMSILGDHSNDIFATIKNLSLLVSALHDSSDLMAGLNRNLSATTALLADDPNEVGNAVKDLDAVVGDANSFIADNRDAIGTTSDKLASLTSAIQGSLDDIKQALHVAPTALSNFTNIYNPTQAALTGALVVNNFANPITAICGAIQAASRLNNQQSAKLCVQYLAPIVKNRQMNFPPLGMNLFVGETARPNEITYSEDWMRPDHVPAPPAQAPPPAPDRTNGPPSQPNSPPGGAAIKASAPVSTDPAAGLSGMMVPPGGGS
jgi:phospholipid/cholesterol/gamma-HCH transport system substrate-binding protein